MLEQMTLSGSEIIPEHKLVADFLLRHLSLFEVKEAVVLSSHTHDFHSELAELVNKQLMIHSIEE